MTGVDPACTGSARFAKHQRILSSNAYQQLLRHAAIRKARGTLQLLAARNTIAVARLGLIVPKRCVAKAHDRNRVKRVIREAFRHRAYGLAPYDIVVRVRGPVTEPSLQENLEWLLDWLAKR